MAHLHCKCGGSEKQNCGASEIGQGRQIMKGGRCKNWADDAREAAGPLGNADVRTLLMLMREIREQAEKWRARQACANRQQREGGQHIQPGPAFGMEQQSPGELRVAFDEREQREAECRANQAQGDQFGLAQFLHQPPNGSALHECTDQPAKNK